MKLLNCINTEGFMDKKNNQIKIMKSILLGIFFCVICIFIKEKNEYLTKYITWTTIGVWIAILFYIVKKDIVFSVMFFQLIFFGQSFSIVSCAFLETNEVWLAELDRYGYITGGSIYLVLYECIFLLAAFFSFSLFKLGFKKNLKKVNKDYLIYKIILFNIFLSAISMVIYGIPLINGMDRFLYYSSIPDLVRLNYGFLMISSLFLGVIGRKNLKYNRGILILILLLEILLSEKFSGIISCVYFYFVGYICVERVNLSFRNTLKLVAAFFLMGIVILQVILHHYRYVSISGIDPFDAFILRIAMQGQIWWGIEQIVSLDTFFNAYRDFLWETKSFFSLEQDKLNIGLYKLMGIVAPDSRVLRYFQNGVRFTAGYPSIILYYFGFIWSIIIQIAIGGMTGILLKLFYYIIKGGDIVLIFLSYKIYQAINEAFGMGNLYVFFSVKVVLYFAAILLLLKFNRRFSYGKFKI